MRLFRDSSVTAAMTMVVTATTLSPTAADLSGGREHVEVGVRVCVGIFGGVGVPFRRKPEGLCSRARANTKGSRKHTGTVHVYVQYVHGASNHSCQNNQFDKMVIMAH